MILRNGQVVLMKLLDESLVTAQVLQETKGYGSGYGGVGKYYDLIILEGPEKGDIRTIPQTMIMPV